MTDDSFSTSLSIIQNDISIAKQSIKGFEKLGSVIKMMDIIHQIEINLELLQLSININSDILDNYIPDIDDHIATSNNLRYKINNIFNGRISTPNTLVIQSNVLTVVAMFQDITKSMKK